LAWRETRSGFYKLFIAKGVNDLPPCPGRMTMGFAGEFVLLAVGGKFPSSGETNQV
jgi:hypothetical protein